MGARQVGAIGLRRAIRLGRLRVGSRVARRIGRKRVLLAFRRRATKMTFMSRVIRVAGSLRRNERLKARKESCDGCFLKIRIVVIMVRRAQNGRLGAAAAFSHRESSLAR